MRTMARRVADKRRAHAIATRVLKHPGLHDYRLSGGCRFTGATNVDYVGHDGVVYASRPASYDKPDAAAVKVVAGVTRMRPRAAKALRRIADPTVSGPTAALLRRDAEPLTLRVMMDELGPVRVQDVDGTRPTLTIASPVLELATGRVVHGSSDGGWLLRHENGSIHADIRTDGFRLERNIVTIDGAGVLPQAAMEAAAGRLLDDVVGGTPLEGLGARIRTIRRTPLGSLKITLHEDPVRAAEVLHGGGWRRA